MDCRIKKIAIVPAHFDNDGAIDRDEFATVTLDIPMDTQTGRDWVAELLGLLTREYVSVEIGSEQLSIAEVKTKTAEIDKAQVKAQLGVTEV